ncbi:hypothetical protein TRVL_08141 [Trypanosoma vivax]|nr:hypothetical protein TRVL_08141 [Trypanosoma vivax]
MLRCQAAAPDAQDAGARRVSRRESRLGQPARRCERAGASTGRGGAHQRPRPVRRRPRAVASCVSLVPCSAFSLVPCRATSPSKWPAYAAPEVRTFPRGVQAARK